MSGRLVCFMSMTGALLADRRRIGGIFWQRNFRLFWIGETVNGVGSSTAIVCVPLLAIQVLHAGTFAVSALSAAATLPVLVIGLPAGAWVDRLPNRPLLITCDVIAALLYASVPLAAWLGVLTIAQLVVVALLAGTASIFFNTALQVFLPTVVSSADLIEGNAKLQGSSSVATVTGRSVAGALADAVGDAAAVLVNAASFLVSAACLLAIRYEAPPRKPVRHTTIRKDITSSLGYIFSDPYLRPMTVYPVLANIAYSGTNALVVVFLVREIKLSSLAVGLLLAAPGAGGVLGAMIARRVARKLGTARALIVSVLVGGGFGLLIPLTAKGPSLVFFALGLGVLAAGFIVTNTIGGTFRQHYTPPEMLGRVTAGMRFPSYCAMPLGALIAGALGTALSVRAALWILLALYPLSVIFLLMSQIRVNRDLPSIPTPG